MNATALREDSPHLPAGLGLAAVLHGLLFAGLAYFFWEHAAAVSPSPVIFELVAPPSPTPGNRAETTAATGLSIKSTTITPLKEFKEIVIPENIPPAVAAPPVKTPPPPKPAEVASTAPADKPAAKPTTQPATYAEWAARNGTSRSSAPPTPARGPSRVIPKIGVDSTSIIQSLENSMGRAGNGGQKGAAGVSNSALSDYIARLRVRLEGAFESPAGLSLTGLKTGVEMMVGARGEVSSWKITRSSGNTVFDTAVREALKRLTYVDPPPGGQAQIFTFEFQWER